MFGFHGPSYRGKPIMDGNFDHYSEMMAKYYPVAIYPWFMSTARYKLNSDYEPVLGKELIRLGFRACN